MQKSTVCNMDNERVVKEYPTMHYMRTPRLDESAVSYEILTKYVWEFRSRIAPWERSNIMCY